MTRYLLLTLLTLLILAGCRKASPAPTAEEASPAWGGLEVVTAGQGDGPAVILLHGYGTPADDLVPLAHALLRDSRLSKLRFVMPAGPLPLPDGGRMWWPLAPRPVRRAQVARGERDVSRERPPELPASRSAVLALIDDVKRRYGLPDDEIAVAGFSQGAMLALQASLHREDPGPVAVLSGSLVAERDLAPFMARARGLHVLITHGRRDDVLPFAGAEHMRDALSDAGAEVRFVPFDGDHTIGPLVVQAFADFLAEALPSGS